MGSRGEEERRGEREAHGVGRGNAGGRGEEVKGRRGEEEGRAVHVFADASVKPEITGIGLAVKDADGRLILWLGKRDKPMTCNEAEYCALIFALEQARLFAAGDVHIYSDSRVVIEQMQGVISVNSDTLRTLYRRAKGLATHYPRICFSHVPREQNELADAMAEDACHPWKNACRPCRSGHVCGG